MKIICSGIKSLDVKNKINVSKLLIKKLNLIRLREVL